MLPAQVFFLSVQDPLSGHVFAFINRRRNQVKLLMWTRGGFTIIHKRLASKPQVGSLYPVVEPDPLAGVRLRSYALTDQLRSIGKRRIQSFAQRPLAPDVMREFDRALRMLLDL